MGAAAGPGFVAGETLSFATTVGAAAFAIGTSQEVGYSSERGRLQNLQLTGYQPKTKTSRTFLEHCCGQHTTVSYRVENDYGGNIGSAIRAYTGQTPLYMNTNASLFSDQDLVNYAGFIYQLKQEIKCLCSSRCAISHRVFRGLPKQQFDKYRQHYEKFYASGQAFLWPGFTSCTRNRLIAESFGDFIVEIDFSEAEGTVFAADIDHLSKFSGEEEVLITTHTGFKVKCIGSWYMDLIPVDTRLLR